MARAGDRPAGVPDHSTIPLTFSIANGLASLAFGFTGFTLMKVLGGKFRDVNWFVYVLTALFIARFVYLARE